MAAGFAALTVGVLVSLCLQIYGERLSQPFHVRFVADIIHHVLHWEPGVNHTRDTLYQVEYKLYGKSPWMAAPDCTGISGHSCNLTYQTMDPSQRYYARVRAVSGNHTSGWTRTNVFSPKEATLRLPDVSLSVKGNTIRVSLHLLLSVGNKTVSYKDIQKFDRQYIIFVKRVSDNSQEVQVETSEEFDIPQLLWGEQYCVSIEPRVLFRPIPSTRTPEKCFSIPEEDGIGIIAVGVGIFVFVLSASLLLGTLLLCAYIKKPVRTPSILKSLIKPSWAEQEHFLPGAKDVAVCLEEELIQQFSFCQKDTVQHSSADSGSSTAQQPPGKGWVFLTSPEGHVHLWEQEALAGGDSSCNSTDSGICLQDSSSGLSQFSGSESQGYKRQLPGGDDSGVSLARQSLCLAHSSSGRDYTAVDEGQAERDGAQEVSPPASGSSPEAVEHVEFRGYLKQPEDTVQRQQDRAEGLLRTHSTEGTGALLETGCSEPAPAKGYLKQASPALPCGNVAAHTALTDTALTRESDLLGFTSSFECRALSWLSYRALGISRTTNPLLELPKAPFALGIFHTDLPATLPLISSLQPNEQLHLELNALSLLGAECKDSRL
ncbi:interleukin-10 receptor subunit alpha [Emydura macquarii macquarii]|uniref:interleukin-10 receptor subunit alpha n=1 Tax=Emydura macquarii macquarii TaxID=1129001 RepID=UPI00352AD1C5